MRTLETLIVPVLRDMPPSHLRRELLKTFSDHRHHFDTIESGFESLTARAQSTETLRRFFQSWGQTNNSAMTVAGIANRMTLILHRGQEAADKKKLLSSLTSLNRIVDEDLAVTHKILHSQMFYNMATRIVGDDAWLSHRYIDDSAKAFKTWKDSNSLRNPDLMVALLTTITHEIYTHGEVEFIRPLFHRWLERDYDFTDSDARKTLAWISVHCGPTEKNHFFYALEAAQHFAAALGKDLNHYQLDEIVGTYLKKKAAVIHDLVEPPCYEVINDSDLRVALRS